MMLRKTVWRKASLFRVYPMGTIATADKSQLDCVFGWVSCHVWVFLQVATLSD